MTGDQSPLGLQDQSALISARITAALPGAMTGDSKEINKLIDSYGQQILVSEQMTTDWVEYGRGVAKTALSIKAVEDSAGKQLTEIQQQIESLQAIEDELNGIADRVDDINKARQQYETAKSELDNSWYLDEIEKLEAIDGWISDIYEAQDAYNTAKSELDNSWYLDEIEKLEAILDSNKTLESLMQNFISAQQAAATATQQLIMGHPSPARPTLSPQMVGYADGGIASGPLSGYTAMLHGTELIVPLNNPKNAYPADGYNNELVEEIRELRKEVSDLKAYNTAIARNTGDVARITQRWELGGMPEERAA